MESKSNSTLRKSLPLIIFIVLFIKVIYSVVLFAMEDPMVDSNGFALETRMIIDTITWTMLALWFLHIYLYVVGRIGRKTLNVANRVVIISAFVKVLSTIFFTFYYLPSGIWSVIFSLLEAVICFVVLIVVCRMWYLDYKDQQSIRKASYHHGEKNDYYTLMDEMQRRLHGGDSYL